MNPNWNRRNEPSQEVADGNEDGDDDEFGEFEGFEGAGVEALQAQAAPSPWATFPDLLPVQTSPATPADESESSGRPFDAHEREPWLQPGGAIQRRGVLEVESEVPNIQPARTLNPPDVSLGTNLPSGRITPDNVHGHSSQASALNLSSDARLSLCEVVALQKQLDDTRHHVTTLEQQLDQLRQRNGQLEGQLSYSQAHIQELNSRLRHEEQAELNAENPTAASGEDMMTILCQLQEEVRSLKETQTEEKNNVHTVKQEILQIKEELCEKFQELRSQVHDETSNLEQRLLSRLGEQQNHIMKGVESAMKHCGQQLCHTVSVMASQDAVQQNGACCGRTEDTLQLVRTELHRHETHQRKVLEQERQRQLIALSTALQAALQHLSTALPSENSDEACGDTIPDH